MFYFLIWVRSHRYHGLKPLTYSFNKRLQIGSVVKVEMQKSIVLGFVSSITIKPKFNTKEIIEALDIPPLPNHLIKLAEWLIEYYPAPLGIITQNLLPENIITKNLLIDNKKQAIPKTKDLLRLNNDQKNAVEAMSNRNNYILHGITGSGKTRVYIELALREIELNRSVFILTPEISLTTQLFNSFQKVFGSRVLVTHSKQTPKERRQVWLKCLFSKEPLIIIGPRSALFMPVNNIGLIVLDEAHETSYKQEQAPQYITSRVAAKLASLANSSLILGSATPLVTDYYLSKAKNRPIIELKSLATLNNHPKNNIKIVDKKDHAQFSRSINFSQELLSAISDTLAKKEQVLLYLNRRGTARLVMCDNCGWQALCPRCDIPLTYHGDKHQIRCHSCNYHLVAPSSCPVCKNVNVVFKSSGTKAIVEEIKQFFPKNSILRFDTDNIQGENFEQKYDDIVNGKVDIIVGTQMIAKGLDLPKLGLVGIILADTSMYLPDFSSEERTFQLISQVLGRIGRGHRPGFAVIQTYHPDQPILKYAINGDYEAFYNSEIKRRQQFLFPPFCYLLKVTFRRSSIKSAEQAANRLKEDLVGKYKVNVEGPAPAFHERFQDKFQWQLVIKALSRNELIKIISILPGNLSYDIDPMDLL